jgi:hypothetical protein
MRARDSNRVNKQANSEVDFDAMIAKSPPAFDCFHIEEPKLVFSHGLLSVDPKSGIEEFGPYSAIKPNVRIGIVGTGSGIDAFRAYLGTATRPIMAGLNARKQHYDSLAIPDFPGVNEMSSYRVSFTTEKSIQREIPLHLFEDAVRPSQVSTKLRQVVELVIKELEALSDSEPEPDVVALVMPPVVERECATVGAAFRGAKLILTPAKKFERKLRRVLQRTGQDFLPFDFGDSPVEGQKRYWNIHHAVKAHAMKFGLPTQIVWETKLRGQGLTQDPASMAWNLFTALYYKSGNTPWQLQQIPRNTCYVGVAFYKETPFADSDMQTTLAQVFSGSGDGLVLKGRKAIVDRNRDSRAHLDEYGAEQLLRQALELYGQHHHTMPTRIVLHKTSKYWPEELKGFRKALGDIYSYDFLTLEKLDTRFMRMGQEPPLRGTVVTLAPGRHAVFTVGYVPYFRLYPGMRIPNPIEIIEHHGHSSTEQICSEIMGLTKINWNSYTFASSDPITILFARTVGRILTELPEGVAPQTKYRFYM